jgi:hypothetical protein
MLQNLKGNFHDAMSNFAMGTILGKGFPQAQVHTVHSTSAEGPSAMNCMHECFWKILSQDCPHGEVAFSTSMCIYNVNLQ